ncbi:MAG: hypothetical protein COV44_09465 [Deltaproteobacteria bacterium CG11_big_fil_rev_8_21_14_0_20_45_16]|nr:MAG: hypothetical protein COV44_09465 [Deltaproteobacteria bacterium CG11_big_fil_rev_8_21_14_0_20_45_16]
MNRVKITARVVQGLKPKDKRYEIHDCELKGFFVRVQPSGRMSYFQTYFIGGKRQKYLLGDLKALTVAHAREQAIQILADASRNKNPREELKKQRVPSLSDFVQKQYGPWVLENRKAGKPTLKHLTSSVYSDFHSKKLNEVSAWLIEKWRTRRRKDGIEFSTINRDVSRLRALLYKAIEWGVINEHPFSKVKQYREDNNKKVRYLTMEEEQSLRKALDEREGEMRIRRVNYNKWRADRSHPTLEDLSGLPFADYLKPMVLLSINTGLRRGELFDLHWSDIDLNQKILTVDGERAKSGRTRYVPLNQEAFNILTQWKEQSKGNPKMVFESRDGGRFQDVKKAWARLLKIAGIQKFRWHDMRHHFASRLVVAGVDLNTVRELLGHSDMKMTLRYAHLSPEVKASAVAKLNRPTPKCPQEAKISHPGVVLI